MPKLGLISLGCAKNLVDSEHMLARLRDAGWEITEDMTEADVGVVNTCGFIEAAKTEAIETILETAQNKQTGNMKGLVVTPAVWCSAMLTRCALSCPRSTYSAERAAMMTSWTRPMRRSRGSRRRTWPI